MKFSGKIVDGPTNKCLNFSGDTDHRLDTGIVFRIRHYGIEIRKVVNEHKFAVYTHSPDGGTGKTCLAAGMHFVSASSFNMEPLLYAVYMENYSIEMNRRLRLRAYELELGVDNDELFCSQLETVSTLRRVMHYNDYCAAAVQVDNSQLSPSLFYSL